MSTLLKANADYTDSFLNLILILKKKTCLAFSAELNQVLKKYVNNIKGQAKEPVDVHPLILNIQKLIVSLG